MLRFVEGGLVWGEMSSVADTDANTDAIRKGRRTLTNLKNIKPTIRVYIFGGPWQLEEHDFLAKGGSRHTSDRLSNLRGRAEWRMALAQEAYGERSKAKRRSRKVLGHANPAGVHSTFHPILTRKIITSFSHTSHTHTSINSYTSPGVRPPQNDAWKGVSKLTHCATRMCEGRRCEQGTNQVWNLMAAVPGTHGRSRSVLQATVHIVQSEAAPAEAPIEGRHPDSEAGTWRSPLALSHNTRHLVTKEMSSPAAT